MKHTVQWDSRYSRIGDGCRLPRVMTPSEAGQWLARAPVASGGNIAEMEWHRLAAISPRALMLPPQLSTPDPNMMPVSVYIRSYARTVDAIQPHSVDIPKWTTDGLDITELIF